MKENKCKKDVILDAALNLFSERGYDAVGVDETARINKNILAELIQKGQVKDYDPGMMAFEYTAPVTTLIAMIDREPDKEEMVMNIIRNHMEHFVEIYGVKGKFEKK